MRLVFMGTPSFAVPVLESLLQSPHHVVGVYTQPDRSAGRGKRLLATPVKEAALRYGVPLFQSASLRSQEAQEGLAALSPEAIVVAAYGRYLPPEVLNLPAKGCLNLHPSLLPKYRGASPVASAILEGDEGTGISIILLDEGMDTGPILAQEETPIGADEDTEVLTARLFKMGTTLLLETLPLWGLGEISPRPQDHSQATLSRRLTKDDGKIDWNLSAGTLWRQIRAYYPWPGSYTFWGGRSLKILRTTLGDENHSAQPGTVVSLARRGIGVTTGHGLLALMRLQLEGRRATDIHEFIQGYPDLLGERLGINE